MTQTEHDQAAKKPSELVYEPVQQDTMPLRESAVMVSTEALPKHEQSRNRNAYIPGGYGGWITPVRDSAAGTELIRKRWDKRNRLAREALAAAGAQVDTLPEAPTHWDMTKHILTQHALNAADPSERSSVQSANLVLKAAYPAPERVLDTLAGDRGPLPVTEQALASLADILRSLVQLKG